MASVANLPAELVSSSLDRLQEGRARLEAMRRDVGTIRATMGSVMARMAAQNVTPLQERELERALAQTLASMERLERVTRTLEIALGFSQPRESPVWIVDAE